MSIRFFQNCANYQNESQALEELSLSLVEYRYQNHNYTLSFREENLTLCVKYRLSESNLVQEYTYNKNRDDQTITLHNRTIIEEDLPPWTTIINEGEKREREPIHFVIPDQTNRKRELFIGITLLFLSLYAVRRIRQSLQGTNTLPRKKTW
ncbi:MAG: hypothetical protein KDK76_07045 [Chlamydiia bacterium]|nr:hypothetical protein [Chlamydiia bacterium]